MLSIHLIYQSCFKLKYAIHLHTYLVIHTTNFKILGSQINYFQ